jgi:hypothetical protein
MYISIYIQICILIYMYAGNISVWNDPLIKAANPTTASLLPNQQINVVVRGQATDTNAIILNYLYDTSPTFQLGTYIYVYIYTYVYICVLLKTFLEIYISCVCIYICITCIFIYICMYT